MKYLLLISFLVFAPITTAGSFTDGVFGDLARENQRQSDRMRQRQYEQENLQLQRERNQIERDRLWQEKQQQFRHTGKHY